jgi:hypothetical protein
MKKIVLITFLTGLMISVMAQRAPMKYGKPSKEDLLKTVYEIDSTAPAVILCNYGYFNGDDFSFRRLIRIKILKKEGYSWANWSFYTGARTSIRAKTFNMENGEVVVDKLSSKSIFVEKLIRNYYVTKISLPNVKVGSVIDIEVSYLWPPLSWYFQETIPVLHSELLLERTDYLSFSKDYYGYVTFDVAEPTHWVAKNVPAFQMEPFMLPVNNYLAHFEIEISVVHFPDQLEINLADSWESVSHTLDRYEGFGVALRSSGIFFNGLAKNIEGTHTSDEEKLKAALDEIRKMDWNGAARLLAKSPGLSSFNTTGSGNSAEVNLSLIRLLQKLDFEVYPVVLKTRSKGQLSKVKKPTLSKLNYVLAYVKVDGKFYLVDATDKLTPYYLLPDRCLNGLGRIASMDTTGWVELNNGKHYIKQAFYQLVLDPEELTLKGNVGFMYKDYAAYEKRKEYRDAGNMQVYLDNLSEKFEDRNIIKDTLINLDDVYKPVKERAEIEIENQCFESDGMVYVNILPDRLLVNPFKQEERKYPVAFLYPKDFKTTVVITVPDGYQPFSVPKPIRLKLPDDGGMFSMMVRVQGTRITLSYRLQINRTIYSQKEYRLLKTFYQQLIDKSSEPVVFKVL